MSYYDLKLYLNHYKLFTQSLNNIITNGYININSVKQK